MKKILKYTLKAAFQSTLDLPLGAEIITLHDQNGEACLWAIVDPEAPIVKRSFTVLPTGSARSDQFFEEHKFIGTFFVESFVLHVFEKVE